MKITVIITGWNRDVHFIDAIESVLDQRLDAQHTVEVIIIVDEDPADPCGEIAERYLPDVTVLRQKKSGASSARNMGMQHACGDFFAFLDGDDFWHPDKLQKQVEYLLSHPEVSIVFSHEIGFEGEASRSLLIDSVVDAGAIRPAANASSFMGRAEVWNLSGTMDESIFIGEFVEWGGRVKAAGALSHTLKPGHVYRRAHKNNLSRVKGGVQAHYLKLLKRHLERKRGSS